VRRRRAGVGHIEDLEDDDYTDRMSMDYSTDSMDEIADIADPDTDTGVVGTGMGWAAGVPWDNEVTGALVAARMKEVGDAKTMRVSGYVYYRQQMGLHADEDRVESGAVVVLLPTSLLLPSFPPPSLALTQKLHPDTYLRCSARYYRSTWR